jgi:hypothetical protein
MKVLLRLIASVLICEAICLGGNDNPDRKSDLTLEISLGNVGEIDYHLINRSEHEITLGIMGCSVWDDWIIESDNAVIGPFDGVCFKNAPVPHKIEPRGNLSGSLPIRSKHEGATQFKIGFVPTDWFTTVSHGTYWSNSISVRSNSIRVIAESEKKKLFVGKEPVKYKGGISDVHVQ